MRCRRARAVGLCPEQVEAGRTAQRAGYAEAEMVVPDEVLAAATAAGHRLDAGYGHPKGMSAIAPYDLEELSAFATDINDSWSQWAVMQQRMRLDLGVDSSTRVAGADPPGNGPSG